MKRYNKLLLFALITIVFVFFTNKISYASSISINTSKSTVSSGETFSVSISGNDATGKINISVDNGSISDKSVWIENNTQSINVTAGNNGSIKITATGEVSDSNGNDQNVSDSVSVSIKSEITITATPNTSESTTTPTNTTKPVATSKPTTEPKKSSNANLSNLVVSPVDFKGFKASKTDGYSVTVNNNVTEVTINATKQDSKANIEISGNKNLKVGENIVSVVITAEDGTKKTYKVTVNRKKEEQTVNTNNEETVGTVALPVEDIPKQSTVEEISEEEKVGITSLKLLGITNNNLTIEPNIIPEFSTDIFEYRCIVSMDVEKIEIQAFTNVEDAIIEVMGNENLIIGDNIITILVKLPDNEKKQSYQIIVKKTTETLDLNNNTKLIEDIIKWMIGVILAIAVIISIMIITKRNKKDEYEKIVYDDYDDKENKKKGKRFK